MRHFSTEKFKSFLLAGTFTAFIGYVNRLFDSVIGRTVRTSSGKKYNAEYADRIIQRATDRDRHVEIEIKIRK